MNSNIASIFDIELLKRKSSSAAPNMIELTQLHQDLDMLLRGFDFHLAAELSLDAKRKCIFMPQTLSSDDKKELWQLIQGYLKDGV